MTAVAATAALALAAPFGADAATPVGASAGASGAGYVVRPGDSLTAIAQRLGVTLSDLVRANRLDSRKPLLIGAQLRLPVRWCPGQRLPIAAGDSLWTVAQRFGITRSKLAAANGLKPDGLLMLGSTISIPARPCPEAATPPTAPVPATPAAAAALAATPATTVAPPAIVEQGPRLTGTALAVLQGKLAAAATDPALAPQLTGVAVIDLASGATVFEQNADLPLVPASTAKLPLLVTAIALLGPGFRTHTDVLTAAPIVGGVMRGDIVLKGYGDPRLSGEGLGRLVGVIRSLGVTTITGSVVADESAFDAQRIGPGWKPEFLFEESPPLSALVVDGIAGEAGPAASAAVLFTKALQGAGTLVAGPPRTGVAAADARVLASIAGPSLAELAAAMGTWSDNYVAETTLKLLGLRVAGQGSSAAGARVVREHLAALGVPLGGVTIADGSGLSSLDRLPARTLAAILAAAAKDPSVAPTLQSSLALGGVTGTLRRRLKAGAAAGIVRAKTGTTDLSSALAGYVGQRYAFAVVSNGSPVDASAAHALQDRVVETLAESLR